MTRCTVNRLPRPDGGIRLGALLLLALLLGGAAVDGSDEEARSELAFLEEAVGAIQENYQEPLDPSFILDRSLRLLTDRLGADYAEFYQPLEGMDPGVARRVFHQIIVEIAAEPGQRFDSYELMENAIDYFCRDVDPYSRYLRSADVALYERLRQPEAAGVGMSLQERDGRLFCFPFDGSPARVAGIRPGDQLLSVDGREIGERPLLFAANLIQGAPGTEVSLRVERDFGRTEVVRVTREAQRFPDVEIEEHVGGLIVRIRRFTEETPGEVRAALEALPASRPVTLDLRGCPGGSMLAVVQTAELFLAPGDGILKLRERGHDEAVFVAEEEPAFHPSSLVLLQDEGTSSAAEAFIAALIESDSIRAVSRGAVTYGKGTVQKSIPLRGGGRLELSSGKLLAPGGKSWEGTGLQASLDHDGEIFPSANP